MSIPPRIHWMRDERGNHFKTCRIHICPESQHHAAWLKFWRTEASAGRFVPAIETHCPCGMHIERCECAQDAPERIAHEVTA